MPSDILSDKTALRAQYQQLRQALPDTAQSDSRIIEAILAHPIYHSAEVLLLYSAVRRELDLTPIFEKALQDGKTVAYPRCEKDHVLSFCPIREQSQLVAGKYGILTPAPHLTPLPPKTLDSALCLVPALAADRHGNRLGYGGGYYDRFLAKTSVISCCAVRQAFLASGLPTESTDIPCQYICTEEGVFVCA